MISDVYRPFKHNIQQHYSNVLPLPPILPQVPLQSLLLVHPTSLAALPQLQAVVIDESQLERHRRAFAKLKARDLLRFAEVDPLNAFMGKLLQWRDTKLSEYDSDAEKRAKHDKKYGGRDGFKASLDAKVQAKLEEEKNKGGK